MTASPHKRYGAHAAGAMISGFTAQTANKTITGTPKISRGLRPAVDADELIAEMNRWLDSGDLVAMAALDGRFEVRDALKHQLTVSTKVRQILNVTFVGIS